MRFTQSFIAAAAAAGVSAQEFLWTGTNQAGAEFGEDVLPGRLGEHYIWPEPESIDVRCFLCTRSACANLFATDTRGHRHEHLPRGH